jgi:hypothetical protein
MMRVVYQDSVAKRILHAKKESEASYRTIKCIELSRNEAVELFDAYPTHFMAPLIQHKETVSDVKIKSVIASGFFGITIKIGE